jgi:phospholipid-binding lipoprotein MlaA
MMRARPVVALALLASLSLGACASMPAAPAIPPQRQLEDVARPGEVFAVEVHDPIEGWNRAVYAFNARLDRAVILPAVNAYRFITPEFVRNRIADFFSNLTEVTTFANAVLQLKPETAGRAALRFINNVLLGFGGLYDIAGNQGGVPQLEEDFGQTLGRWGVGAGPYLVLPLLGPSNVRDASGLVVDTVGFTLLFPPGVRNSIPYLATAYLLRPIDRRNQVPFRYYRTGSPFEYDLIRLLYTRTREFQIAK